MFERDMEAEQEFLRTYHQGDWPRPSLTADVCLFRIGEQGDIDVLLIRRGGHPYKGCWALPGGFSEPGEEIEQTAVRELAEETGLSSVALERTYVYSGPGRDPRGWTATQVFVGLADIHDVACAGDDAMDAQWFSVQALRHGSSLEMSLQHGAIDIALDAGIVSLPYTGHKRSVGETAEGLAFDHARLLADAYLYIEDILQSALAKYRSETSE